MRKDYMNSAGSSDMDETGFVEDHWTKIWEQEGGPQGRIERIARQDEYRLMAPYIRSMSKDVRILDGGCGMGDWVLCLARKGFDITGLDLSRKTVAQLQARFPYAKFAAGDIRSTGFPDKSFDAYYSWGVFEHFEVGPGECLQEALRILKPGGTLFISVPLDNFRQSVIGTFAPARPHMEGDRFYQYRFTRSELAREISSSGFELVSFHPIHKRQGVLRVLHHEFGMPYQWLLTRGLSVLLSPLIPAWWVAHMILAVARKPSRVT